jgi:hypothetical protein
MKSSYSPVGVPPFIRTRIALSFFDVAYRYRGIFLMDRPGERPVG